VQSPVRDYGLIQSIQILEENGKVKKNDVNKFKAGLMNDVQNKQVLARLLDQAYLEVIPSKTIMDRLMHIPRRCYVAITCSPTHGLEPTLELVENLRKLPDKRQLKLIPHIAARMVRDKGHLKEILARLEAANVESLFVPGGDIKAPVGIYNNSLQLLQDIAEIGHNIEDIGIAAYPEGHPLISDRELLLFLKKKQQFATYTVTQMCFDPETLVSWLKEIRKTGITLPAWIGLPGVADISKLISLSFRIGVGQSLRVLKKQKGLLKNLISARPYQPDDLLEGLLSHLDDPGFIVPGFHLYSFNDIERTEKWRAETYEKLNG
jgi:methylenetetrahydrofolate reductase (NADPH)